MTTAYLAPATSGSRAYLAPDVPPAPAPPAGIDISQIATAHISVFDGTGSRVGIFDGTGARTVINGVSMATPTLVNGKMTCNRDPDEESYYGADITQELADRNTTAKSVALVLAGVKSLADPQLQTATIANVQRTYVVAFLGNVTDGTLPEGSYWTARVRCNNGESFDKTTYLKRVDT